MCEWKIHYVLFVGKVLSFLLNDSGKKRMNTRMLDALRNDEDIDILMPSVAMSHHWSVLAQRHVVATECWHKQNRSNVFETVNPFSPLRTLSSHIEHPNNIKNLSNSTQPSDQDHSQTWTWCRWFWSAFRWRPVCGCALAKHLLGLASTYPSRCGPCSRNSYKQEDIYVINVSLLFLDSFHNSNLTH